VAYQFPPLPESQYITVQNAILWRLLSRNEMDRIVSRDSLVLAAPPPPNHVNPTWADLESSGIVFLGAKEGLYLKGIFSNVHLLIC